jgi:biotin-(acetyl-CoA carboxylase) ligase
LYDHPDAVLESARAFGNLSRSEAVLEWMRETRVDEVMLILIDHSRTDIVHAICGILINMTNDSHGRHIEMFIKGSLPDRLLEVLDRADVHLVTLIMQILHNLTYIENMFNPEQSQHLRDTVSEMVHHLQEEVEAEEQDRDPSYDLESITRLQSVAANLLQQLDLINK